MERWAPPPQFDGYRLRRLLGRGAMGEVYLADDTLLERQVALKFISSAGHVDEQARRRFLQEARAIARLQHPNVVTIHRVGEIEGRPYLVSEFIEGEGLDAMHRPVPWPRVLKMGLEIARALSVAHRRGVIHRDIKPANAILSHDGEVKLLDFGIARLLDPSLAAVEDGARDLSPEHRDQPAAERGTPTATAEPQGPAGAASRAQAETQEVASRAQAETQEVASRAQAETQEVAPEAAASAMADTLLPHKDPALAVQPSAMAPSLSELTAPGMVLGTPAYMAPEIWRGEPATFRSDIYSLGALLYVMSAGRPPHVCAGLEELSKAAQDEDADPLLTAAPTVHPALAAIIDRCLARDPSRRFASGNDVREALTQLSPGARGSVVPRGNPYRGLQAFEAEHRAVFFGRDSETRMILDRLQTQPLVIVAGDSGVGKSSLCRAGVLPRLGEMLDGSREWTVASLVPGHHPLTSLSHALAPLLGENEAEVARSLVEDPNGAVRRLRARLGAQAGAVVFIDQLEELVTVSDAGERVAVCEVLGWLAVPVGSFRLLATVRADFLSRLAALPHLGERVSPALYFVRPLSAERVREVITGPARSMGITLESEDMVDQLVASTMSSEGGLPLLQFTLSQLWDARRAEEHVIARTSLDALGGIAGALSRHADDVLARMLAPERLAARSLLLRLVTPAGTRARRTETELDAGDPPHRAALEALVRGRLVVARDTAEGPAYEIAHEALIQEWQTLARWLSTDADERVVRERLSQAAGEWERLGRTMEVLWSGRQLGEARDLDDRELAPLALAFLQASRRAQRRRRALRLALLLGVPLLVGLAYVGLEARARQELSRRVDGEMRAATRSLLQARTVGAQAERRRLAALSRFDKQDREGGERAWSQYRSSDLVLFPLYVEASNHLETALNLDGARRDVRAALADTLYDRALLAESRFRPEESRELQQRLALYDDGGQRLARWRAPARLALELRPAAAVELWRYRSSSLGGSVREPVVWPAGARELELPAGSYLLILRAPQRAETRYPVLLRRGERAQVSLELPLASSVPPGLVHVPAGQFLFGSAVDDGQRRDFLHTAPLHPVTTGAYLIARHETTFADWIDFLRALPPAERDSRLPRVKGGFQGALTLQPLESGDWQLSFQPAGRAFSARSGESISYPGRSRRITQRWLRFPVVGISIADARAYLSWLDRSGRVPGARLCSETEWERAARGADGREYPHGDSLAPDDANIDDTYGKNPLALGPDEVGSHPASESPFGLHDMAGNVWEWTASTMRPGEIVARGGSYSFGANSSRATDREITEPGFRDASVGLRVCADPGPR